LAREGKNPEYNRGKKPSIGHGGGGESGGVISPEPGG